MQITFFGAAREVTGSCSLVEASGKRILIDCGMFQGSDFNEGKNSDPLPFDPKTLDAVIVTHAHLDHVGRLPLLAQNGYSGNYYATPPTIELAKLIMEDALEVMIYNNRKFGSPVLYSQGDVNEVVARFKPVDYYTTTVIPTEPAGRVEGSLLQSPRDSSASLRSARNDSKNDVAFKFYDAGHIFGSAFVEFFAEGKRVVFSGDVGNVDMPILRDTDVLPADIDALVCESTYGDRNHEPSSERQNMVEEMIAGAMKRGGTLMIPSFSLERTQELLYDLNDLIDRKKRLPRVPIFLDSPLAINATAVYRKYTQYYNDDAKKLVQAGDDLFNFPGLTMCETREESKKINMVPIGKIIIAGAGMMNGGRIVHHALRYLSDYKNTLLIIGYQAQGTLGRQILDGAPYVNIMGERVAVHCVIKAIGAFSAHADQEKLMDWIGGGDTLPKKVYLNHGEPPASEALAKRLNEDLGLKTTVVDFKLTVKV